MSTANGIGTQDEVLTLRLKNYILIPPSLEVKPGKRVVLRNFQESSAFTITSKGRLFENKKLAYREEFEYTFDQAGTYNFKVKESPKIQMTITVK
jgi:plastocyanin